MRILRLLLAVLGVALMAGCALVAPRSDPPREVARLLADYRRLGALDADQQRREFHAAQAAFEAAPNDLTRLNLALVLLLPRAPWRDDARVQALLGGIEAAPGDADPARRDLAQLLLDLVALRQRELRDDQRKLDQLARQLREERHKSAEIQQKIDALRAIDRDLMLQRKLP